MIVGAMCAAGVRGDEAALPTSTKRRHYCFSLMANSYRPILEGSLSRQSEQDTSRLVALTNPLAAECETFQRGQR
jgi:molybdopterin-guanine dinucleotide biosynthesis protein A